MDKTIQGQLGNDLTSAQLLFSIRRDLKGASSDFDEFDNKDNIKQTPSQTKQVQVEDILGVLEDDLKDFFFGCSIQIRNDPVLVKAPKTQIKQEFKEYYVKAPLKTIKWQFEVNGERVQLEVRAYRANDRLSGDKQLRIESDFE